MSKEILITTYNDYFSFIQTLNSKTLFYRGQEDDWPLVGKLFRLKLLEELQVSEMNIIQEFKRRVQSPKYNISLNSYCELDILSLANHYGLPTRLLDWTESSSYALWFCVRKMKLDNNGYGVVWILEDNESYLIDDIAKYNPYVNIEDFKIFKVQNYNSVRLAAQYGLFSLPVFSKNKQEFIPLNLLNNLKGEIIKVKIPYKNFCEIRRDLLVRSIDEEILFPDIDGLCRCIEMRNVMHEDDLIRQIVQQESLKSKIK